MNDWTAIAAIGALVLSGLAFLSKSLDKSLSIREYEAYSAAVARDIARIEGRLMHTEQSRPTTGELQIVADALNKRIDEMRDRNHLQES